MAGYVSIEQSRRLWLVRHGVTAWNIQHRFAGQSDVPLTDEGRLQARWLAQRLQTIRFKAVYSSDLGRAYKTAEIIVSQHAKPTQPVFIQTSPAWRELDFGVWDGLTYAEIASQFPERLDFFTGSLQSAPPEGESLLQLQERVMVALRQIIAEHPTGEGDLLLVSHGGPLRLLICTLLGMPLARQWQLALAPGSLSALDLVSGADEATPSGILTLLNEQRIVQEN